MAVAAFAFGELQGVGGLTDGSRPPRPAAHDPRAGRPRGRLGVRQLRGLQAHALGIPQDDLVVAPELGVADVSQAAQKGLVHESNDNWWRLVYAEAGLDYPEEVRELTLSRCDLPIEAARLGLGTAVGDDVIAEQELRSGALVPVAGPRLDTQDYFLLTRRAPTAPSKAVTTWLLDQAESFAAWQQDFNARHVHDR